MHSGFFLRRHWSSSTPLTTSNSTSSTWPDRRNGSVEWSRLLNTSRTKTENDTGQEGQQERGNTHLVAAALDAECFWLEMWLVGLVLYGESFFDRVENSPVLLSPQNATSFSLECLACLAAHWPGSNYVLRTPFSCPVSRDDDDNLPPRHSTEQPTKRRRKPRCYIRMSGISCHGSERATNMNHTLNKKSD